MGLRISLVTLLLAGVLTGSLATFPGAVYAQDDDYEEDDYGDEDDEYGDEDDEYEDDEYGDEDGEDAAGDGDDEEGAYDYVGFDVHALFNYYLAAGIGLRVDLPVVPEGLLHGSDDDLRISMGVDVEWFFGDTEKSGIGVIPVLAFQWNFYLSDAWSIFPEIGAALLFVPKRDRILPSFLGPEVALGIRRHFNQHNALLFRVGWPTGIHIGLTF